MNKQMINCIHYVNRTKCHYTGKECNDKVAQTCTDYKSDEGLYECPHCDLKGLKLMDYGEDKVWECLRCGAELWYCEPIGEMLERCKEIKEMVMCE